MNKNHQYLLLSAYDRVIEHPEAFNTRNQAFDAMIDGLARQLDDFSAWKLKKHFKNDTLEELDGFDDYFSFGESHAWYTGSDNFDWKIVEITIQNNRIT